MMDDKDCEDYHNIGKPVKWNNKFTYPKSQRDIVMGRRHYAVDDQKLPSVTTILSKTQTKESKILWLIGELELARKRHNGSWTRHLQEGLQCIRYWSTI